MAAFLAYTCMSTCLSKLVSLNSLNYCFITSIYSLNTVLSFVISHSLELFQPYLLGVVVFNSPRSYLFTSGWACPPEPGLPKFCQVSEAPGSVLLDLR